MSSDSILGSVDSEKRWVLEMEMNFPQQHTVDIDLDTPSCVFRVPKGLSETKPEAYAPQRIGLGPYHHLRPELYTMQKQKLAAVRKFIKPENLNKVQQVVEALLKWDPVVRACYDQYLDLDSRTLSWILAIDGLYLLQYLRSNARKTDENNASDDGEMEKLAGDIIMLENQIPVVLLEKIRLVLLDQSDQPDFIDHILLHDFLVANSPLKLSKQRAVLMGDISHSHLLHRMYHLIVNNRVVKDSIWVARKLRKAYAAQEHYLKDTSTNDIDRSLRFLDEQGVPGARLAENILSFMENVPWDKILALFNREGHDQQHPLVEEIDIPSVSQMTEIAGITFTMIPGGIRDIQFNEEERKFYLPVITLKTHSEIVLRNLVAYEAASAKPGTILELAEYVDLMCGLIDTKKDVDILKKEKIIEGELPDEEVVRMFNGIRKSTGKSKKEQSNIEQAIDNVNRSYDDVGSVKVKRFLKKYLNVSLKIVSVAVAVVVVVLLTLQAFCSVFGCARWFGKSSMVQGFHFLYADQ